MKMKATMNRKTFWGGAILLSGLTLAGPAIAEEAATISGVADNLTQLAYSLDTFYFLMSGALVMWMAAGFAMLEAGLVRGKNTVEILTKNVALYSIACLMYLIVGYNIMYGDAVSSVIPGLSFFLGPDNGVDEVLKRGGET